MSIVVKPDPADPRPWQGDVFPDAPWSLVRDLEFVSPTGDGRRYSVVQPPQSGGRGRLVTRAGIGLGMLLSHECVVDKEGREPVAFCRLLRLATLPNEQAKQAVRNGSMYAAFYLPALPGVIEESFADFRFVVAVEPQRLQTLRRIASLTDEGRASLRHQLILYWTRVEPIHPVTPMAP